MDWLDLWNFKIFYPYTTPMKIIKSEERIRRNTERERSILKLKQCKTAPIVNEKRYHKNIFK